MDDINLKKAFEATYPADGDYWTFSADPRVQLEQLQGVQGNRAAINVSTILNDADIQEKKEKDNADFDQFAAAMEEAQRLFLEASQAAQFALNNLGNALDTLQTDLNQLREDFDQNTVTLSDGTNAYYNTEMARFERQDNQGNWHKLEEDAMVEAIQKAKANGGIASTKQGKQAIDERQAALDGGFLFIITQHDRLVEIDEAVESGTISVEEATRQKKDITEKSTAYKRELEQDGLEFRHKLTPVEINEQSKSRNNYNDQDIKEWEKQAGADELQTLFDNEEEPAAKPVITGPTL